MDIESGYERLMAMSGYVKGTQDAPTVRKITRQKTTSIVKKGVHCDGDHSSLDNLRDKQN